ncbi:DUF6973 domain-containing protein [Methanolobus psychrotolerans]|uniref:DUF6973 domain-containing protein n=1 Tax=Methanolobus psychrotolerans TaxID=1874706 RepID=UPI000B917383|nr:hypothetical protein [Methanolobus psychrotolerans]
MKINIKFGLGTILAAMLLASFVLMPAVSAEQSKKINDDLSESQMLQYVDIEELHAEVTTYIEKHPDATEKQINDYTIKKIRELYGKSKSDGTISTKISYYGFTLNPAEEALFYENSWKAINSCYYGKKAMDRTKSIFGFNGADDASDAFRHTYWNALMVKHIDYTWAERWATAHEYNSSGLPKTMDLWNNNKGRGIGNNNPSASDSTISNKVVIVLNSGNQLKKIVNNNLVYTCNEI